MIEPELSKPFWAKLLNNFVTRLNEYLLIGDGELQLPRGNHAHPNNGLGYVSHTAYGTTVSSTGLQSASSASATISLQANRKYRFDVQCIAGATTGSVGGKINFEQDGVVVFVRQVWVAGSASSQRETVFGFWFLSTTDAIDVTFNMSCLRESGSNQLDMINAQWAVYDVGPA
jgi:hypothetical protein